MISSCPFDRKNVRGREPGLLPRLAIREQIPYRLAPTRLTPPFALLPALWRTAARATGRGLSTTPALATQPAGYSTYWQYTTAAADPGLRITPATPNRALAAIPVTVTVLMERQFLDFMMIFLLALTDCRSNESRFTCD
jgi:hypothetical protein